MTSGGSTYQIHARIAKKIINLDREANNKCCWDDCDKDSLALYVHIQCNHPVGWPCRRAQYIAMTHGEPGAHQRFAFCSERHQAYFVESQGWRATRLAEQNGGRVAGMLPTGSKNLAL
jgi:hypothetical protein